MRKMIKLNEQDKNWIDSMWERLENKLSKTAVNIRDFIPYTTNDGKYVPSPQEGVTWWTNGFYGGMMWIMYNATKKEEYKEAAEHQEKLLNEAWKNYDGLHHDVGFMWGLASKPNYILNGNRDSRAKSLYAANFLMARLNIRGGYIQAWPGRPEYSIIDCMLNIPILYWASRELNDKRFEYVAKMHA